MVQVRRFVSIAVAVAAAASLLTGVGADTASASPTVAPSTAAKGLTVRVMTFNVLHAKKEKFSGVPDKDLTWSKRGPQVAARIRWNQPDVVGFQENSTTVKLAGGSTGKQLRTIDNELLPDYQFVYLDRTTPIAFLKAKYTLVTSGSRQVAWIGKEGATHDRWMVWVVLRDRQTKGLFGVVNNHLVPGNAASVTTSRVAQTRRIAAEVKKLVASYHLPFVVTGDFNVNSRSDKTVSKLMTGAGIVDSYKLAKKITSEVPGSSSMSHFGATIGGKFRYRAVRTDSNSHLDYVWVPKGATVKTWRVSSGPNLHKVKVAGKWYPFFPSSAPIPSDHSPVVATVTFSS